LGRAQEELSSWKLVSLAFIGKVKNPSSMKEFRGISQLDVIGKWYMKCLVAIAQKSVPLIFRVKWNSVNSYAFQRGHQTAHIGTLLTELVNRANTFRGSEVSIVEGDVQTCFDDVSLDLIERSLTFWQFHPRIVHAFLVELEALQGMAVLGTISIPKPFCYDKLRQGGSDGPFL